MRVRGEAGVKRLWFSSQTALWPSNCLPTHPSWYPDTLSQSAAALPICNSPLFPGKSSAGQAQSGLPSRIRQQPVASQKGVRTLPAGPRRQVIQNGRRCTVLKDSERKTGIHDLPIAARPGSFASAAAALLSCRRERRPCRSQEGCRRAAEIRHWRIQVSAPRPGNDLPTCRQRAPQPSSQ